MRFDSHRPHFHCNLRLPTQLFIVVPLVIPSSNTMRLSCNKAARRDLLIHGQRIPTTKSLLSYDGLAYAPISTRWLPEPRSDPLLPPQIALGSVVCPGSSSKAAQRCIGHHRQAYTGSEILHLFAYKPPSVYGYLWGHLVYGHQDRFPESSQS